MLAALQQWAQSHYLARWQTIIPPSQQSVADCTWSALAGHASFRQYYRFSYPQGPACIAVYAPPVHEDIQHFAKMARYFDAGGIPVPRVFATDTEKGYGLVEDLGARSLWQTVVKTTDERQWRRWYACALRILLQIQSCPRVFPDETAYRLPCYRLAHLEQELTYFPVWFMARLLDCPFSPAQQQQWEALCRILLSCLQSQPHCPVHRDYHAMNLVCRYGGNAEYALGVLDFQDAVWGPYIYDVVSLLCDAYLVLPAAVFRDAQRYYYDHIKDGRKWQDSRFSALKAGHFSAFLRDFDYACLQRHLKIVGIFSRLHLRDGKSQYLQYMPRLLQSIVRICARYPGPIAAWGATLSPCMGEITRVLQEAASSCTR